MNLSSPEIDERVRENKTTSIEKSFFDDQLLLFYSTYTCIYVYSKERERKKKKRKLTKQHLFFVIFIFTEFNDFCMQTLAIRTISDHNQW